MGFFRDLIGHGKLCPLPDKPSGCWLESVIVKKTMRGKGIGKLLMLRLEATAVAQGYDTAYLSTHDQQGFYSKLGYMYG